MEVKESIEYLTSNKKNKRLENITNELVSSILVMVKKMNKDDALKKIDEVVNSGKAAEKFEKMVFAHDGSIEKLTFSYP